MPYAIKHRHTHTHTQSHIMPYAIKHRLPTHSHTMPYAIKHRLPTRSHTMPYAIKHRHTHTHTHVHHRVSTVKRGALYMVWRRAPCSPKSTNPPDGDGAVGGVRVELWSCLSGAGVGVGWRCGVLWRPDEVSVLIWKDSHYLLREGRFIQIIFPLSFFV